MISEIGEILSKAETKLDSATILVFGTTGYILDAQINVFSQIEPGVCGILFASGFLGLKKGFENRVERYKVRKELIKKTEKILNILVKNSFSLEINGLKSKRQLFEEELLSNDDYNDFLNDTLKKLQEESNRDNG